MSTETKISDGERQARAQFESVAEMVQAVKEARARDDGSFDWEEEARKRGFSETEDGLFFKPGFHRSPIGEPEYSSECLDAETLCRALHPRDYPDEDETRQAIDEDALSVEVRSGWYNPCSPDKDASDPEEYRILLCTGGPAVQIVGDLDQWKQPKTAMIQFQDWFTPWQEWRDLPGDGEEILLEYARHFWFGE